MPQKQEANPNCQKMILSFSGFYETHRNSQYFIQTKKMKRPQSAKPGFKGYWGQASTDDINQQSAVSKNNQHRKQVKLMRPDLTTHDFARILPKKIQQDKQRLYSQALQLKQNLNEVSEQNIRLKTKISILQKEKDKMNRYLETAPEGGLSKQTNSRMNIYGPKGNEKENNIIRTLKKIVRESKDEMEYLKVESQKIKKTMKYTKMNELEIERKTVMDENRKLAAMLEQYASQIVSQDELERENQQLKKYLQEEIEQNRQLSEENQKYQEVVETLEDKIRSQNEKYQAKQKKMGRDLAMEKRKGLEQQKHIEDLRRQLNSMQSDQAINMKKKQNKPLIRPTPSHPNAQYSSQTSSQPSNLRENALNIAVQDVQAQQVKNRNEQLQKQLKQIKLKLEQSQTQLKNRKLRDNSYKESVVQKAEKVQQRQKSKDQEKSLSLHKQSPVQMGGKPEVVKLEKKYDFSDSPHKEAHKEEESYTNAFEGEQSYSQQFQKSEQPKQPSQLKTQNDHIQKLKKDFQQNQQEQQLYKKEPASKKKIGEDKKKKEKQGKGQYKPGKKMLAEIKELLTYRMRSQRYPFQDLRADIQTADSPTFTYADLCNMLVNEPFYLTSNYTKTFLSYCYQKQSIDQGETLEKPTLISKLRKVVDDFELMQESEQKEMILRIAEMTSTYPYELETAFENIKNGEETVARKDLIQMFQKLELEDQYIDLIIAELSLCSDDLEHLNFHGFFERFYVEEEGFNDPDAIEEQGEESEESHKNTSRVKKQGRSVRKPSEEFGQKLGKYVGQPSIQNKHYIYDEEDIVSDDGRI